jgi:hypothetical protein
VVRDGDMAVLRHRRLVCWRQFMATVMTWRRGGVTAGRRRHVTLTAAAWWWQRFVWRRLDGHGDRRRHSKTSRLAMRL